MESELRILTSLVLITTICLFLVRSRYSDFMPSKLYPVTSNRVSETGPEGGETYMIPG